MGYSGLPAAAHNLTHQAAEELATPQPTHPVAGWQLPHYTG